MFLRVRLSKKKLLGGAAILVIFGLAVYVLTVVTAGVPVMNKFQNSTVYTIETDRDSQPFRQDCEKKGGVFNECGSSCDFGEEFCDNACAFTCDFSAPGD